jgi:hypothetical protein
MSNQDEELQKKIEANQHTDGSDIDVRSYQYVFRAISATTETLPQNFSDQIISKLIAKQKKESSREWWLIGLGIFLLVIAFMVAIAYSGFKLEMGFLKKISAYTGLFLFGAAFILVLSIFEKRLLQIGRRSEAS